jgi:lipopolysaccharide heptosyltransferase I
MARKRILIVKLSSLGDLFHALPAVHCLKAGLDADVDWVTQPEYEPVVKCCTDISEVIVFPRRHWVPRAGAFLHALRAREYDLAIDLQGLLKSALVVKLARARKTIGPSFHREGAHLLYDAVAGKCNKDRHAIEECMDVVRYLGLVEFPVEFPIRFPAQESAKPGIAVIPVSRAANKNWPQEHFVQAAQHLAERTEYGIYLFGSAADRPVCDAIEAALVSSAGRARVVNLAGKTSLVEMGGWLSVMRLVVANDSGSIHMAAALGVPVVAVFGPTDPRRTGPYGAGHRAVMADVACRPCFKKTCDRDVPECLQKASPEKVVHAALEVLGQVPVAPR